MSDFITDVERQYEMYCKIAEEHGFIDLNAKKNGFRCTTKSNEFNAGWIAFTGAVAAVRDEQQAIIDDLIYKAELRESDHRALLVKYQATKKCWEDVGGKCEELKAQLNNMEVCYIEKKKEVEELQKTNISLEAGLRKNSKNKQKLLGKNIELQKRIDEALQEVKGLERFTGEDCIADFDVLQGAVSHACKRLEKTLRGAND